MSSVNDLNGIPTKTSPFNLFCIFCTHTAFQKEKKKTARSVFGL